MNVLFNRRSSANCLDVYPLDQAVNHHQLGGRHKGSEILRLCASTDGSLGIGSLSELLETADVELSRLAKLGAKIINYKWALVNIDRPAHDIDRDVLDVLWIKLRKSHPCVPKGHILGAVVEIVDDSVAHTQHFRDLTNVISDAYFANTTLGRPYLSDVRTQQFLPAKRFRKPLYVDIEPRLELKRTNN